MIAGSVKEGTVSPPSNKSRRRWKWNRRNRQVNSAALLESSDHTPPTCVSVKDCHRRSQPCRMTVNRLTSFISQQASLHLKFEALWKFCDATWVHQLMPAQSGSFWCNYHPQDPSKPCPAAGWLLPGIFPDLQMKRHVRCIFPVQATVKTFIKLCFFSVSNFTSSCFFPSLNGSFSLWS